MTILTGNLKILASESMDDSPNGGGGLVETAIVDGQSNNIFKDISHLKRVYGGVNMAKVNAAVRTQTNEPLLGAFVFLDKIPADKKLSVNLFKTNEPYDVRTDAAAKVENYRAQGGRYIGTLYGTQYQGSQVVMLFQTETSQVPVTGDVLLLMRTSPPAEQYIYVTSVATQLQNFTDATGIYTRKIVTLNIAVPLAYNFVGSELTRMDANSALAMLYQTVVANAARYYSARPLKTAVALGDYALQVDSIYSQVVPSSQSEMPLVDLTAAGSTTPLIPSSDNLISIAIGYSLGANVSVYLGRSCYPNTLNMVYGGGNIIDNAGQIMLGGQSIGTINYAAGIIAFGATAPSIGGGVVANFKPAGVPLAVADTDSIPVTDASRSFVHVFNITPPPQPNALSVSFMALGNWYEFRDNGAGGLIPLTEGTGAGSINYVTGSGAITFASLPDIGSQIILAWGKQVDYTNRAGAVIKCSVTKQLSHPHIVGASLAIRWFEADTTTQRTITSNAAGVLSGYGTGALNTLTGKVIFYPTSMPVKDTVFDFEYDYVAGDAAVKVSKSLTSFDMNAHVVTLNVQDVNIIAGSVVVSWVNAWGSTVPIPVPPLDVGVYLALPLVASGLTNKEVYDNAAGAWTGGRAGVVNYTTGIITLEWFTAIPVKFPFFIPNKSRLVNLSAA
jgi:hypothetical protein